MVFPALDNEGNYGNEKGLTKREYFASLVLQGLLTKYTLKTPEDQTIISKMAIELTDTFISELNK